MNRKNLTAAVLAGFLTLLSGAVLADAITDAKNVLDVLSSHGPNPKTLTNAQMLSIVEKYNSANGFSNPWSEEDNPDEFAAWPTNLEKATFFLQKLGGEIRSDMQQVADADSDAAERAARVALRQQYADEL